MNSIGNAMKNAGVKIPSQMERIWNWLTDHPNQTAQEVAKALKFPGTSSLIAQMQRRNMLLISYDDCRLKGQKVKRFKPITKTYILLPQSKETLGQRKKIVSAAVSTHIPTPLQTPQVTIATLKTPAFAWNVEAMTIADARALYLQLHKMFGK